MREVWIEGLWTVCVRGVSEGRRAGYDTVPEDGSPEFSLGLWWTEGLDQYGPSTWKFDGVLLYLRRRF